MSLDLTAILAFAKDEGASDLHISPGEMFAFLGPKYDGEMKKFYTTLKTRDVYRLQPIRGLFNRTVTADGKSITALPVPVVEVFRCAQIDASYPALGSANDVKVPRPSFRKYRLANVSA